MARNTLDVQEQEQLEALKGFWARFGDYITWALIIVLGGYAAFNGWNYWQARQGAKAAVLYAELERSVHADDVKHLEQVIGDMKSRYGRTTYAAYGALLAASAFQEHDQPAQSKEQLAWVADKAPDDGLRAIARLRLASLQIGAEEYDAALQTLSKRMPPQFAALAADRRGDVYRLQGKRSEAVAEYRQAYAKLAQQDTDYQQVVGIKLNALGVDPDAAHKTETG
ncbi:MAG: tetratricopeptide repeat protein [Ottowia sp.]|nr:tetratricopeptide repeat protein [Ottowia sp.]